MNLDGIRQRQAKRLETLGVERRQSTQDIAWLLERLDACAALVEKWSWRGEATHRVLYVRCAEELGAVLAEETNDKD